ncbi:MAG: hypothetical protein ABEH83_05065, partial [Halobacterium sp.]
DVHVVYNDARLDAPDAAAYDVHTYQDTDVTTSHHLTTSGLRDVLYDDVDFLHFVGHVTEHGLVCSDGVLDVRTLARTGVKAFFLNGCRSYEQGRALLTAGAVGGIVTVDDVADATAGGVGSDAAVLLDAGYALYAVLDVLSRTGVPADRYTVLGDGTFSVRRTVTSGPILYDFDTDAYAPGADPIPFTVRCYPYDENSMGAVVSHSFSDAASHVQSASPRHATITREELSDYLADPGIPTLVDGDLYLTDDLSVDDFP